MQRTPHRLAVVVAVAVLMSAGCASDEAADGSGPDLEIERRIGYAVVVEESAGATTIGFSTDRNATSGEAHDVTQALWRVGPDGPWSQPPVACLGRGQRIELGIAEVQDVARPGLLFERVVWLSCLDPEAEE